MALKSLFCTQESFESSHWQINRWGVDWVTFCSICTPGNFSDPTQTQATSLLLKPSNPPLWARYSPILCVTRRNTRLDKCNSDSHSHKSLMSPSEVHTPSQFSFIGAPRTHGSCGALVPRAASCAKTWDNEAIAQLLLAIALYPKIQGDILIMQIWQNYLLKLPKIKIEWSLP